MSLVKLCVLALCLVATVDVLANDVNMENKIMSIFETKYKNNSLNLDIKKIQIVYDSHPKMSMGIKCLNNEQFAMIFYGDLLIQADKYDPYVVAATLAHELGHCYHKDDINHHDAEYFADRYGVTLFMSTGGTKEQFVQRFIDRDSGGSDTHPSDYSRLNKIMGR